MPEDEWLGDGDKKFSGDEVIYFCKNKPKETINNQKRNNMIRIDQIKCKKGYARVQKVGLLFEWRGEAEFILPQKVIGDEDQGAMYFGPLFGHKEDPIEISGYVYINRCFMDDNKLITGVQFVGSDAPIRANGKKLIAYKTKGEII